MPTKKRPESERVCNLIPSEHTEKDWTFGDAVTSQALGAPAQLPASVDLRASWWNINNQESTGSCVGWASTDGVARYHMVKASKIAKPGKLSARATWMASKETDQFVSTPSTFLEGSGTSLKAAMVILLKYGCVPEEMLPLHISTLMYTGSESTFYSTAASRRITAYFNLGLDLNQWRTWLATKGPIMAGVGVDQTWDSATANKGKLDTFKPATVRGGHAICVVGYTTDKRFIIRNSWGTAWGDKGFAYASEGYIKAGFFNESYGATV